MIAEAKQKAELERMIRHYETKSAPVRQNGVWCCPSCGKRVQSNHSHCHRCGKKIGWE